jgi:nucleotide-binding universal stress UspA family protein
MTEPIVVATDGSTNATAAVEWAADDAARKGLPLRIVHAVDRLPYDIPRDPIPGALDRNMESGQQILQHAETVARGRRPGIDIAVEMVNGAPTSVLWQQATNAAELVVGSRGLGGFAGMLLGSVSQHVAGHVAIPVVVVRPGPTAIHGEVVVGFDGSPESEVALAYAFEEARLRGSRLRAIYAWQLPVHVYAVDIPYDIDEVRQAQEQFALGKVTTWQDKFPDVPVAADSICAHPVTALVGASARADLLVVGSRGHGAISAMVLGSVSRDVLHHAHCPVAVVRS